MAKLLSSDAGLSAVVRRSAPFLPGRKVGHARTAPTGRASCPPLGTGLPFVLCTVALTACAPLPSPDVSVRHVPSTDFYNGTRMHLFVFDPREPRSLDTRIRLAQAELARDPDCRWAGAPRSVIKDATAKQGAAYADTLLAAPVTCTA